MKIKTGVALALIIVLFGLFTPLFASVQDSGSNNYSCAAYVTGIGCPACAKAEPLVLSQWLSEFPELAVIEYEIYKAGRDNRETAQKYFDSFLCETARPGVPFLVLNEKCHIGVHPIKSAEEKIREESALHCPMPDGNLVPLNELKPSDLTGRPRIWTKNRVFILESDDFTNLDGKTRDSCIRSLIQAENVDDILAEIDFQEVEPELVNTSRGKIAFENAVVIGNWRMQWGQPVLPEKGKAAASEEDRILEEDEPAPPKKPVDKTTPPFSSNWLPFVLAFVLGLFLALIILKWQKIVSFLKTRKKNFFIISIAIVLLVGVFIAALNISSSFLRDLGYQLPLPLFTFVVALVDGFNPCNMFVLTVLLALLISSSASRRRFYLVGFIFILIVFLFYFFFMAAWLNIFRYIGFAGPLRIIIAIIALVAGLINCKEFFFFKKGPSLMIADKHKGALYAKMRNLTEVINKGSLPLLISSSVALAIFSSLIEIPCTAGFPLLYTSVLAAQVGTDGFGYIFYLIFYNLVYVFPLLAIIAILGFTFRAQRISERQVQIIKLIGGIIMILLGIILLANPELIGAGL